MWKRHCPLLVSRKSLADTAHVASNLHSRLDPWSHAASGRRPPNGQLIAGLIPRANGVTNPDMARALTERDQALELRVLSLVQEVLRADTPRCRRSEIRRAEQPSRRPGCERCQPSPPTGIAGASRLSAPSARFRIGETSTERPSAREHWPHGSGLKRSARHDESATRSPVGGGYRDATGDRTLRRLGRALRAANRVPPALRGVRKRPRTTDQLPRVRPTRSAAFPILGSTDSGWALSVAPFARSISVRSWRVQLLRSSNHCGMSRFLPRCRLTPGLGQLSGPTEQLSLPMSYMKVHSTTQPRTGSRWLQQGRPSG